MVKIDQWESETIERIRELASRARMNVEELIRKNREEIQHRFKQVSNDIEQRQKNGNYLEKEIDAVKNQLKQLKNGIGNIYANIHVSVTTENEIHWDTLIFVTENDVQNRFKSESRELPKVERAQRVSDRNSSSSMIDNSRSKVRSVKDSGPGKFRLCLNIFNWGMILTFVERKKSGSPPSDSADVGRRKDLVQLCLICRRNYQDSRLTGICSDCEQEIKPAPVARHAMPMQYSPFTDYPTWYRGHGAIPREPFVPKLRSVKRVVCSNCECDNMVHVTSDRMDYNCSICGTHLSLSAISWHSCRFSQPSLLSMEADARVGIHPCQKVLLCG